MNLVHTRDLVDNTLLREAFLESGLTPGDVARRLGWLCPKKKSNGKTYQMADSSRVRRRLGLGMVVDGKTGERRTQTLVTYEMAVTLARAIGADPVEVGL